MARLEFGRALENVWQLVQDANKFIDENKPWVLAKNDQEELGRVMNLVWGQIGLIRAFLIPFLPETADKIAEIFFVNEGEKVTKKAEILFPKKYLHSEEPVRK